MQMQRPYSNRAFHFVAPFCLLLAATLSGCASKNPLMEEPTTPVAASPTPVATTSAKVAETAPTATATPAAPVAESQADGNKTVENATAATSATTATDTDSSVKTVQQKRFLGFLSPYRPDVQQGNFVSKEMVAQLKEGMTPNQVVFLLGTPLLNDIFHKDRWDYVFRMQKGNGEITSSHVSVFFSNGLVSHFEGGGDLPTEADYLARIANKAKAAKK